MKIKTTELIGWQLDYTVDQLEKAGAGAHAVTSFANGKVVQMRFNQRWVNGYETWDTYSPSTDWAQGGPIIEREKLSVKSRDKADWKAVGWFNDEAVIKSPFGFGSTPLIAAMRCYVASKLGDEVEVP